MYSYRQNKFDLKKSKMLKNKIFSSIGSCEKKTLKKKKIKSIEILNEHIIGCKSIIFVRNNFNSDKYIFDYNNLYLIPISEHIFIEIYKINWLSVNVNINRNGDLVNRMYFRVELPNLSVDHYSKIDKLIEPNSKIDKLIDYIKLFIYSDHKINFDTFIFSEYLKELYIECENFNYNLINLPKELNFLSICSKIFNQNLSFLPNKLEYLYINSDCFDTNLTKLPTELKVLSIVTSILTIKFDNLPQGLKILHVNSKIVTNQDIFSYLPESLEYLYIISTNLTMINLSNLPRGLKVLYIMTQKSFDKNIEEILPKNLVQLKLIDENSL